ncbi:MAG: zonular occludens toxin domain-containing protein [Methylococcales bacterium]|nr:zonular occludens toxin domain-containing protein [Methylococcales bacterium]
MPGWIIQGVRGEGKSLAAVGKIREYMLRGRPVATNLDLFLEHLLPADNMAIAYRLPDHPRLQDFELLPPAYDRKYKGEDMNGLLVLDELGTWLNSRSWNDKTRLQMLNWLFLSRKDHWDLILLAQDHEMIDSQVRTTLCDYLVQASRLDRQKIPYIAPLLKFLGFNSFMPRIHRYHVYYGLSMQQNPVDSWTFTGKDIYNGYDTNQRFRDGTEALCGTLVDMRATYTYLPAGYLTRHVFIDRLNQEIAKLKVTIKVDNMAKPKTAENPQLKIIILSAMLVLFLGWRFFSGGFQVPKLSVSEALPTTNNQPIPQNQPVALPSLVNQPSPSNQPATVNQPVAYVAHQTNEIIEYLLKTYRPRLSLSAQSPEMGLLGNVDFYDEFELVETYSIKELHALGVTLVRKPYGADLLYAGKSFIVSAWNMPHQPTQQTLEPKKTEEKPSIESEKLSLNP